MAPAILKSPALGSPGHAAEQQQPSSERQKQSNTSSWYSKSWSRKTAPVAQVARGSISAASDAAAHLSAVSRTTRTPRLLQSTKIPGRKMSHTSDRCAPADAAMTAVNVSSDHTVTKASLASELPKPVDALPSTSPTTPKTKDDQSTSPSANAAQKAVTEGPALPEASNPATTTRGWLTWIKRSEPQGALSAQSNGQFEDQIQQADTALDASPIEDQAEVSEIGAIVPATDAYGEIDAQASSWLSLWRYTCRRPMQPSGQDSEGTLSGTGRHRREEQQGPSTDAATHGDRFMPPKQTRGTGKSSGWAFWSKDVAADPDPAAPPHDEVGELAVTDTPSQQHPKRASISLAKSSPEQNKETARVETPNVSKGKPTSTSPNAPVKSAQDTLQKNVPNLLLPSLAGTYHVQESSSLLQQIGRYFSFSSTSKPRHVHLMRDAVRVQKCIAIGVHGYFPAPLIRTVLGQPTGTSIRFSNHAAHAIRRWADRHGYECDIEKIALEGEGRIAERVDLLWKLLLNWIDDIRRADFIMLACHSQGVPVAIMLVEKLISFGCVNTARIGICAMAGINLGPFAEYRSRWISGSTGELFEFANPKSQVSCDYLRSLGCVLEFGVRIVFVGSIDDQLVPLESALLSPALHPYIFRAVFVDGRVHAPGFLTHLVGFALKLRNLGFSDHGLVRELSSPLAGSLYGGEGHSKLYDEESIYDLGLEFALRTTEVKDAKLHIARSDSVPSQNPFILPFAMRGLLEEDYVKTELHDETLTLLDEFDRWTPSTKVLKDVKFRLEGIRSKL